MEFTMQRLRFALASLALLAASAVPAQVPDTLTHHLAPAAVASTTLSQVPPASTPAVRAALSTPHAPATRVPLELMAFAFVGATKKTTRRSAGKKRDMPMYIDSDLHVARKDDDKKPYTHVIKGGQLLDDVEDDGLTEEEIDEFIARRAIRPATPDEIARLEQAEVNDERTQLQADQARELDALRADQAAELAAAPENKRAALQEKQQKAVDALTEKHVAAVNKLGT
jgi:hypothetical protein